MRTVFLTSFFISQSTREVKFAKFGRVFKFEASREAVQCRIQGISMTQKIADAFKGPRLLGNKKMAPRVQGPWRLAQFGNGRMLS